jgi:ABC-type nitrate/sulfonate/bicarbonate transport system substrate-binding protein
MPRRLSRLRRHWPFSSGRGAAADKKRDRSLVPILLGALVVTGLASGLMLLTAPHGAPRAAPVIKREPPPAALTLRLNAPVDARFAGLLLAVRNGKFAAEDVDVRLEDGRSDADAIDRVVAGKDLVGLARGDRFLRARAEGKPLVAFAAGYLDSPVVFYATDMPGLTGAADFIDRRVGFRRAGDVALIYQALMARLMISRSRVREVSAAVTPAALADGTVDVWTGYINDESQVACHGGMPCKIVRPADFGIHVPGTVYFARERTLRESPELISRFLRGVIAGWQFAYSADGRTALRAAMPAAAGDQALLDLELQHDFVRPPGRRIAEFDENGWRTLRELLDRAGLLKAPVDLSRAVSFDILREAYRKRLTPEDRAFLAGLPPVH